MWDFPFFPESASTLAARVDTIYFILILLSLAFAVPVAGFIIFFAIRYRKGTQVNRLKVLTEDMRIEVTWSLIPFLLAMGVFTWAAAVYFDARRPPQDTLDIYILGKQWMWKAQHSNGKSEINDLHIPLNQPVKLIMTSQDVIHSFYIPAFRIKQDVLPGRFTTMWFEATKTGEYHLFCAEYCGTDHSRMGGTVYVMDKLAYERWLSGNAGNQTLAQQGAQLFERRGCASCHSGAADARGPNLAGIFGSEQALAGGGTVTVDEAYLRESIINPQAKVVAGYDPIMPTFDGIIDEDGLIKLIAYIKSLKAN